MNIYLSHVAPLVWSAWLEGDERQYLAGGHSDLNAVENLEAKLVARLDEIEAEADWIRKALAEKFPVSL